MLLFLMFVEVHFQLCFVFTLITVQVVDIVVDFIMFLKTFSCSSGVVTGGTPQKVLNFVFFMIIVFFMNTLYVFEVAVLTPATFITELTHSETFSQFVILYITDIL